MEPFHLVTDILQGDEYPTLGMVLYYTSKIKSIFEKEVICCGTKNWSFEKLPDILKEVVQFIRKDMVDRWNWFTCDPTFTLGVAMICHPFFKSYFKAKHFPSDYVEYSEKRFQREVFEVSGVSSEEQFKKLHENQFLDNICNPEDPSEPFQAVKKARPNSYLSNAEKAHKLFGAADDSESEDENDKASNSDDSSVV